MASEWLAAFPARTESDILPCSGANRSCKSIVDHLQLRKMKISWQQRPEPLSRCLRHIIFSETKIKRKEHIWWTNSMESTLNGFCWAPWPMPMDDNISSGSWQSCGHENSSAKVVPRHGPHGSYSKKDLDMVLLFLLTTWLKVGNMKWDQINVDR